MSLSQHLSLCMVQDDLHSLVPSFLSHEAAGFAVSVLAGVAVVFVSLALSCAIALVDMNAAIASIPTNNVTFFIEFVFYDSTLLLT